LVLSVSWFPLTTSNSALPQGATQTKSGRPKTETPFYGKRRAPSAKVSAIAFSWSRKAILGLTAANTSILAHHDLETFQ